MLDLFFLSNRSFVGILLHGASGSGKTLLGKSLPAILNHKNFIAVSGTVKLEITVFGSLNISLGTLLKCYFKVFF